MHLGSLKLTRFRSCEQILVPFQPDLTVLVGENNGGKSNLIDAVRILTMPLNGRRDRYAEDDDLRRDATVTNFEIEGYLNGLSPALKGLLISAVPDPTKDEAIVGFRYEARSGNVSRGRTTRWVGRFDSTEPESGSTDLIRHVYLPPLRDAQQALGGGSTPRVMALFHQFLPKEQEAAFVTSVRRENSPIPLLAAMNAEIKTALDSLTSGVRRQDAKVSFGAETLQDVARDLRFKLADANLALEDIRASGLGYSNLLYMSTIIVELSKAKDADLTIFLVEEPEAHLHPQLQMLVLEFPLEQAKKSAGRPVVAGQPEGRVQVVVTTHSPNLTAWVSPKHLVVVKSQRATEPPNTRAITSVVPISSLRIRPRTLAKIERYLDVTRSALLFGNKAILVEGIAEAILLPIIARHLVLAGDREAWLRFKANVIASIEGVDFRPYVEVLLSPHTGTRIADRVVIITDADPTVRGNRKEDLLARAASVGAQNCLSVFVNTQTLEHDLFLAGNETLLKNAFLKLHRGSRQDWATSIEAIAPVLRPAAFMSLITAKKTRKGDLAQEIASRISAGQTFVVPEYLEQAICKSAEP